MPVIRVEKTHDYTVMSNYHFKDKNLSLKAKGLMSLMLSLPDDWDYTINGLAALSKDGISSVRSALQELEVNNYLKTERERDEQGRLGKSVYVLYEKPNAENQTQAKEKPVAENRTLDVERPNVENPTLDNPILENPMLENRRQLNTNTNKVLNTSSTKGLNTTPAAEPAPKPQKADKEPKKDPFDVESPKLCQALKDFRDMRKAIRKPLTLRAKELIVKRLEELAPNNEVRKVAILNQSTMNGWQNVYDLKTDESKHTWRAGGGSSVPSANDLADDAMSIVNQMYQEGA